MLLCLLPIGCGILKATKTTNGPVVIPAGDIRLELNNKTTTWQSNQIYFAIIAKNADGKFSRVDRNGNLIPCAISDNTASNSLVKNGQSYSNYFMSIADVPVLPLKKMSSARMFIGIGSPLYIKINTDINGDIGFAGPDPSNSADPNRDVYFDFIELTFNDIGFFGNTTQVDQFGFPMVMTLTGNQLGTQTVGITKPRATIMSAFTDETPTLFHQLVNEYRINAPYKGGFQSTTEGQTYLDSYIDHIWTRYKSESLSITIPDEGATVGSVSGTDVFSFVRTSTGETGTVSRKPTTEEVLECSGVMATGSRFDKVAQAHLSAAINRHIVESSDEWGTGSLFYQTAPANYYASFWHRHSLGNRAYGFAYDDVNNFATLVQDTGPTKLEIDIRWD